jgi:hypothetical protein
MQLLRSIIILLTIISCSTKKDNQTYTKETLTVEIFDLLNYVLTDTVDIGLVKDNCKSVSDIPMLPPPFWGGEGSLKNYLSEVLSEKDTLFIASQLRDSETFRTNELAKYGFKIINIEKLQTKTLGMEEFWDNIYKEYGPGFITVSRPIFNRERSMVYIRFGYSCGEMCGGGVDIIMQNINGKWSIKEYVGGWEV